MLRERHRGQLHIGHPLVVMLAPKSDVFRRRAYRAELNGGLIERTPTRGSEVMPVDPAYLGDRFEEFVPSSSGRRRYIPSPPFLSFPFLAESLRRPPEGFRSLPE